MRRSYCFAERLSNDKELDLNVSKAFFNDDRIKSSRRYLRVEPDPGAEEDFDELQGLSHREEQASLHEAAAQNPIDQVNQTEQSEFRNLP